MSDVIHVGLVQNGIFYADYAHDYAEFLRALEGDEVELIVRKKRSKRTIRQNAWLHSFLRPLAERLGYTLPELKLVGLVAVFSTHDVMGYTVPEKPSTSDLSTSEMTDLCEWYVEQAAKLDPPFLILYPEEFKRQKRKAKELAQKKQERSHAA